MLTSANRLSAPVVAAWGMGIDSTAMIIEWVARGLPLSAVLTADTGTERDETYAFLPIFQQWMEVSSIMSCAMCPAVSSIGRPISRCWKTA
jgi:3'-phosphoadenosine 5'-phosphosulfate sulfotransferase (PAPS reductase)/FAD synthetase